MILDAFCSSLVYLAHLAPIWAALPHAHVTPGDFWTTNPEVEEAAWAHGIEARLVNAPGGTGPIMVASWVDLRAAPHRPVIFVEHGAGQTYRDMPHPSYAGGGGRERVCLFICPSKRVVALNRATYPQTPAVAVGCPALDRWHAGAETSVPMAVAISFHWPCSVAPEAGSAFDFYARALSELAGTFDEVIGHAHPRIFAELAPRYEASGIEPVASFGEVLRRAAVYAVDNSSTLYEFASLARPVVVLNAPWFRRDVEHGLRFWEMADVGVQVDEPGDLVDGVKLALADPPVIRMRRDEITSAVYAACDGHAADRAARAIAELASVNA